MYSRRWLKDLQMQEFGRRQRLLDVSRIETTIRELERTGSELRQEIKMAEERERKFDPSHFAYPLYAKAARDRLTNVERTAASLKGTLDLLRQRVEEIPLVPLS